MKSTRFIFCVLLLGLDLSAQTFTPKPNSPLAKGVHPRLFVTADGVIAMREKIKTYYKPDFQNFVNDLDGLYNVSPGSGALAEWNVIFATARAFALLYQIDPVTIGVTAQRSKNEYGQKALAIGLYLAQKLPDDWDELHHGASNLTTDEGGLASLALQVVYDWTHDLSTLEQRQALATRLITMWDNRYDSEKVKLENHYAANVHVYGGALCFYNDTDLGASFTASAKKMMDSFQDVFIERQLGVAAKIFEGSSDWMEGDSYSMDAFIGLMMLAGAAGSALDENFFATNPWLHKAPYFIYYSINPMPYDGEYYFTQHNTASGLTGRNRNTSAIMNMAAASLQASHPNLAAFAAWFCEKSPYGLRVDDYAYYEPHLFDFFYKFVFGTRPVAKKSPAEAAIPLSSHLGQMHVMRSDHDVDDATLVQFFSPQYWYQNGHNEEESGSFNLHRFGPLVIAAVCTKNAGAGIPRAESGKGMALNNVFGLGPDKELSLEKGSISDEADTPQDFEIGANTHIGTVEAREHLPGLHDYVNYNYTRAYKAGSKATLARRALVYLRGPVNREFVVIMDRVESKQEKYFVIHTPVDIEAIGSAWSEAGSGHWTSAAKTVQVTNRLDRSHGQMYLTSVWPQNTTLHKFGGPGYEWVWADGSKVDYRGAFSDLARFLYSDHTLQIRSPENLFLTAMQIGDANTMAEPATVEGMAGVFWIGALLDKERLVIFNKTEKPLAEFYYSINSSKTVKHLLTELDRRREFTVTKGASVVARGTTGPNGTIAFSDQPNGAATYTVKLGAASAVSEDGEAAVIPKTLELRNYPNPFNPNTTIAFSLPKSGNATLTIYNTAGQLVRTLISTPVSSGAHQIQWDATNDDGSRVNSGVYLCRLEYGGAVSQVKLVLTK
jgi:hypothetical protein